VIVVWSRSASQFLGGRKFEEGALRCLTAFAKPEDMLGLKCTTLEQPNFVSGVPASGNIFSV